MALILMWLHPDRMRTGGEAPHFDKSALAGLVTGAWENLKTGERRAVYDASRKAQAEHREGAAVCAGRAQRRPGPRRIEPEPLLTRLLTYLVGFK